MGNKEFELVSLLIKELPKYPESHSRGSDFYNMTFNILQEYVRNKFSDVTVDKISLGGFSEIVGTNYNAILKSLKKTAKNPSITKKKSPYGDGNSAKKIVQHLKNNL